MFFVLTMTTVEFKGQAEPPTWWNRSMNSYMWLSSQDMVWCPTEVENAPWQGLLSRKHSHIQGFCPLLSSLCPCHLDSWPCSFRLPSASGSASFCCRLLRSGSTLHDPMGTMESDRAALLFLFHLNINEYWSIELKVKHNFKQNNHGHLKITSPYYWGFRAGTVKILN
jgi:hypothetical protein